METDIMASYYNGETFADENYSNFSIVNKKKRARQRAAAELAAEAAAVAAAAQARYNSNPNSFNSIEVGSPVAIAAAAAAAASLAEAAEQKRRDAVNAIVTNLTQQEKNIMEAAYNSDYKAQPQQPIIEVIDTIPSKIPLKKGIVSNTNKVDDSTDASKVSDSTDANKVPATSINNKVANTPPKQPTKNKFFTPTVIGIGLVIIGAIAYLKMRKKTV